MFKLLAVLVFLGVCWTAKVPIPSVVPSVVPIISQENVVQHDGTFHYGYETGDGTVVHQEGQLKVFEDGKEGQVVQGSYSYVDKDGQTVSLTYVADETGFNPQGEHLPVAPEIPAPIAKALKFIEEHPTLPPEKVGV